MSLYFVSIFFVSSVLIARTFSCSCRDDHPSLTEKACRRHVVAKVRIVDVLPDVTPSPPPLLPQSFGEGDKEGRGSNQGSLFGGQSAPIFGGGPPPPQRSPPLGGGRHPSDGSAGPPHGPHQFGGEPPMHPAGNPEHSFGLPPDIGPPRPAADVDPSSVRTYHARTSRQGFRVEFLKVYRNITNRSLDPFVSSPPTPETCGVTFMKDEDYLLFADVDGAGKLRTIACFGNAIWQSLPDETIQALENRNSKIDSCPRPERNNTWRGYTSTSTTRMPEKHIEPTPHFRLFQNHPLHP